MNVKFQKILNLMKFVQIVYISVTFKGHKQEQNVTIYQVDTHSTVL